MATRRRRDLGQKSNGAAPATQQSFSLSDCDIQCLSLDPDKDDRVFELDPAGADTVAGLSQAMKESAILAHAKSGSELAEFLHPNHPAEFLASFYDKRPLLLRAEGAATRFSRLYSRRFIKQALDRRRIDFEHARLVTAKGRFCTSDFLASSPPSAKALAEKIFEFVERDGGTFNVSRVYKHCDKVAELATLLNRVFKARISASAFFTGPKGQAFPVHWDTFDTIILQVEGEKTWTLYEAVVEAPLPDIHYSTRYDLERLKVLFEVTLQAGDLLLVPRGFPHKARTTQRHSLHLTIGVQTPTWYEFFAAILNRALVESRPLLDFRADCYLCGAPKSLRDEYAGPMLEKFAQLVREVVQSDYFLDHCAARDGMAADVPGAGEAIDAATVLGRRGGFSILEEIGERVHLRFHRHRLIFPLHAKRSLEFLAQASTFSFGDMPDELDLESRSILVRKLIAIGFLHTAGSTAAVRHRKHESAAVSDSSHPAGRRRGAPGPTAQAPRAKGKSRVEPLAQSH